MSITSAAPSFRASRTGPRAQLTIAAATALWFAAGLFIPVPSVAPVTPPPSAFSRAPVLAVGQAVERALAASESQSFDADLAAGRPYGIAVEQRGIDVIVEVRGPLGKRLAAVDGPLERWGTKVVLLRPVTAGIHQVEVRSEKRGVGPGRYEIRLDELPDSTFAEQERIGALRAATRAGELLYRPAPGSLEPARKAFEEARELFRSAGDRTGEADATAAIA